MLPLCNRVFDRALAPPTCENLRNAVYAKRYLLIWDKGRGTELRRSQAWIHRPANAEY
jgi:hypothetical protein